MLKIKDIFSLLILAAIIVGAGQFLPGLAVLFDNFLVSFFLVAMTILIIRVGYKAYVAKLPPEVCEKREKEIRAWRAETNSAIFCSSDPLDLENMINKKSIFDEESPTGCAEMSSSTFCSSASLDIQNLMDDSSLFDDH